MKRILTCLIAVLALLLSGNALAAHPATLAPDTEGNATNLIAIRKPETTKSATTKTTYGLTGASKAGVSVAVYRRDNGAETYAALRNDNDAIAKTTIGASGIFYKQVSLGEGHNRFAVRAEAADGTYQIVYFDINVLKQEILDNINTFTYDVQSIFNGWA